MLLSSDCSTKFDRLISGSVKPLISLHRSLDFKGRSEFNPGLVGIFIAARRSGYTRVGIKTTWIALSRTPRPNESVLSHKTLEGIVTSLDQGCAALGSGGSR